MKVKFVPQNVEFEIKPGQSVLHVAQDNGIYIKSVCKGVPSCAECRVRVTEGDHNVLPPGSEELSLIGTGHFIDRRRLSCQLKCFGDITVDMNEQIAKEQGLIMGQKKKNAMKNDRVEQAVVIRSEERSSRDEETSSNDSGPGPGAPRGPRAGGGDRGPRSGNRSRPGQSSGPSRPGGGETSQAPRVDETASSVESGVVDAQSAEPTSQGEQQLPQQQQRTQSQPRQPRQQNSRPQNGEPRREGGGRPQGQPQQPRAQGPRPQGGDQRRDGGRPQGPRPQGDQQPRRDGGRPQQNAGRPQQQRPPNAEGSEGPIDASAEGPQGEGTPGGKRRRRRRGKGGGGGGGGQPGNGPGNSGPSGNSGTP